MKKIQTVSIESLDHAVQLHEKNIELFKDNIQMHLGFVNTSKNVASTLIAQYTCRLSQIVFTFGDLMAWCDEKDIIANGVQAESIKRWEDGLSFNPKQASHEGITIMSTKAEMTEAMEELAYCLDNLNLSDFIPDWKQQVVDNVVSFQAAH